MVLFFVELFLQPLIIIASHKLEEEMNSFSKSATLIRSFM
jgi:hypothetical protein